MFRLQLQVRRCGLFVAVALGPFLTGCAGGKKSEAKASTPGNWYSVTAQQTAFYHHGPLEGTVPDTQLPRDSIMKVIRPSFGFVKVQLQDGESGYVASEDIGPASQSLVADKLAPPPPLDPVVANHEYSQEEQFQLDSSDPRLIAPPEPLPEANPKPEFRY